MAEHYTGAELREGNDVRVGGLIGALWVEQIRIARFDRRPGLLGVNRERNEKARMALRPSLQTRRSNRIDLLFDERH
jgi:hypothetical protein